MPADGTRPGPGPAIAAYLAAVPAGFRITLDHGPERILIRQMRAHRTRQGTGERMLAALIQLADAHALPVRLYADPTLEPGDPDLATLVRWYARHGFRAVGRTADDWVRMDRPVGAQAGPAEPAGQGLTAWLLDLPQCEAEE